MIGECGCGKSSAINTLLTCLDKNKTQSIGNSKRSTTLET